MSIVLATLEAILTPSLMEWAGRIASAPERLRKILYGPWLGSMRSRSADTVPREYVSGGSNFHYHPRSGRFKRRAGQSQKFDTFGGGAVGMLPAKWGARARWMEEFTSDSITDGIPTVGTLLTKETVVTGLDDGRFSQFWLRDQVNSANYTVGKDYSISTTYQPIGTQQTHKIVPLWYDSGDGGLTRGVSEFSRRFFFSGSRRFLKVGKETYFPSLLGTPSRWRGEFAPAAVLNPNRLMPSGPLPPLHAGTCTKGTVISDGSEISLRCDADLTVGGWTTAPLFSKVDESTLDTSDFIQSAPAAAACTLGIADPGFVPIASAVVRMSVVASVAATSIPYSYLKFELLETATVRKTLILGFFNTGWQTRTFTLTAAEVASITDWTAVRYRLTHYSGAQTIRVAQLNLGIQQSGVETQGGWKGSDRFYRGIAFRFEDGSIWAPCPPRPPSTALTDGFGLFTVDPDNPNTTYDRVTWNNIPIGPHGCVGRLILRSPKISAVQDDNLQISPYDLRVAWEIQDNTTTTYDDYYGSDESLRLDAAALFIRYDHIMPPRARYIFGGDMRVCHSYGGQNPCAIVIAPVGRATDYDLNLADDSATAYTPQGSWMQLSLATSGVMTLTLIQGDGATASSTSTFTSTDYATLQKLVDAINATTCTATAPLDQQWRAQLCPGANPDATTLSLTPHNRAIASCVVDNAAKTITKAGGGLSKVAVGQLIAGAEEEGGAYVTVINSDTLLTYSGTLVTTTETLYFYNDLGDAQITDPDTSALGFQRVTCGALPGFLYFTHTYLAGAPIDKGAVWMTVANPGQAKSAANNFSGKSSNRFTAPANAGISMGGGGVDQGFVVPFANQVYAIRNVRDQGSGEDSDYRMVALNESRGCCAWNTVVPGNRFVPYLTPEGMCAADLTGEMLLSEATFVHAPTPTGDFSYEIPLCVAAAARDIDYSTADTTITAYASARILRGILLVNYRASGSHPNRQVPYDFSSGNPSNGLAALARPDGSPWGWGLPLLSALSGDRSFTAMCEGRRSDGAHLYAWNDQNAGSTGDGRIDEFETGDTDNGTAIAGSVETPWERLGLKTPLSGHQVILEHSAAAGSTGALVFHRSLSDTSYSMTPSTGTEIYQRDLKFLPLAARAPTAACYLSYSQATGAARELRSMELTIEELADSIR